MQTTDPNHNRHHAPGVSSLSAVSAEKLPGIRHFISVGKSTVSLKIARRGLRMFEKVQVPILGVVENMRRHKLLDPKTIRSDVSPRQIVSIGNYAIQFDWSDGHKSGIYRFKDLRALGARAAAKSIENVYALLVDLPVSIRAETSLAAPDTCRFIVSRTLHPGGPFFFGNKVPHE